jgi:asparagine synthase (glutamine-hydrolysing)
MRGPERSHYIHSNSYTLAFHRLAINGLSPTKDQPYVYDNSGENHFYLLCNGEIYNAKELYKQVLGLDWVDGMSDTQVIYDLWRHWNYDFTKLNQELLGEYALAILVCDHRDKPKELYLSTDYISVRPLFYYIDTDSELVGFSSLLSGLSKLPKPELIKRLPGNKQVIVQFDNNDIASYTRLSISDDPVPLEEITDSSTEIYYKPIVDTLCESVKRRMISDREIGCLLSGGLDSSLTSALVALEAKKVGKRVHTFSIGFAGSPDCKYAKIVADHIGSIHTEITVTEEEALAVIPEVIRVATSNLKPDNS